MNRIPSLLLFAALSCLVFEGSAHANHAPKWKVKVYGPQKPCGFAPTMESNARLDPESFPSFDYDIDLRTTVSDPLYYILEDTLWNLGGNQRPEDRCDDFLAWHDIGIGAMADIACLPEGGRTGSAMCQAFQADPARVRTAMVLYHAEAAIQCPEKEFGEQFGRYNIGLQLNEESILGLINITSELDDFEVQHLIADDGVIGWPEDAWEWFLKKEKVEACGLTPPISCPGIYGVDNISRLYAEAEELADNAFRGLLGFLVQEPICDPDYDDMGGDITPIPGTDYFVWDLGPLAGCPEILPPIGDPICEEVFVCDRCDGEQCLCVKDGQVDPDGYCICAENGPHNCGPHILQANGYRMLKNLIQNNHDEYLCQVSQFAVAVGLLDAPICTFDDAIGAITSLGL